MSIKEQLFKAMEDMADQFESNDVTLIVCCEKPKAEFPTMVGYRNYHGSGMIITVFAPSEIIKVITQAAFDLSTGAARSDHSEKK